MGIQSCVSFLSSFSKRTLLILSLMSLTSCGGNLFEAMSGKTSREAVMEEIRKLTDAQQFSDAIALIEANPDIAPTREEKFLFASSYAGACGLTFASLFTSLATASGSPMEFAKNAFLTRAVVPANCYEAQQIIESIGAAGVRSSSENVAMFMIGLAKVGTYLKNRADNDGNGVLDVGYDSCDNTDLPRADIKQIITGFGLMIENIAALGTNLSGGMSSSISSLATACATLGISCNVTNPSGISDGDADSFRDAIKSDRTSDFGIETCPISPACCP